MGNTIDLLAPTPLEESLELQAQADMDCPEGVPDTHICYRVAPEPLPGNDCNGDLAKAIDATETLLGPAADGSDPVPGTCGTVRHKPGFRAF